MLGGGIQGQLEGRNGGQIRSYFIVYMHEILKNKENNLKIKKKITYRKSMLFIKKKKVYVNVKWNTI